MRVIIYLLLYSSMATPATATEFDGVAKVNLPKKPSLGPSIDLLYDIELIYSTRPD